MFNHSDTCAVPSVCNAVGLLILLKLCPVFSFLQQLMTKNIWRGTVSEWTHRLLKEVHNLERSLYCACWDSCPRLSGRGSNLSQKNPILQRFLANEFNRSPIMSTSALGVACTSARRRGHPAQADFFWKKTFVSHPSYFGPIPGEPSCWAPICINRGSQKYNSKISIRNVHTESVLIIKDNLLVTCRTNV